MLRVLGIDAGLQRTGWGVIDSSGPRLTAVAFGVVRTDADRPIEQRLLTIHDGLSAVIDEHHPDACAIEDIFMAKHARSALVLGEARGAALLAVARSRLPTFAYPPALVKRSIAGRGAAPKEQVQNVIRAVLGLREVPPHDAADALAVAICHANASRVHIAWDRARART
ncbi:MAG: crossover junction endodeoxyribonuclease RuvC [Deltaproteobacteria bacterium]|nr:crossover junction endodeoxyribonuclease RuvC [Deltaproteobacteria bacterium]